MKNLYVLRIHQVQVENEIFASRYILTAVFQITNIM